MTSISNPIQLLASMKSSAENRMEIEQQYRHSLLARLEARMTIVEDIKIKNEIEKEIADFKKFGKECPCFRYIQFPHVVKLILEDCVKIISGKQIPDLDLLKNACYMIVDDMCKTRLANDSQESQQDKIQNYLLQYIKNETQEISALGMLATILFLKNLQKSENFPGSIELYDIASKYKQYKDFEIDSILSLFKDKLDEQTKAKSKEQALINAITLIENSIFPLFKPIDPKEFLLSVYDNVYQSEEEKQSRIKPLCKMYSEKQLRQMFADVGSLIKKIKVKETKDKRAKDFVKKTVKDFIEQHYGLTQPIDKNLVKQPIQLFCTVGVVLAGCRATLEFGPEVGTTIISVVPEITRIGLDYVCQDSNDDVLKREKIDKIQDLAKAFVCLVDSEITSKAGMFQSSEVFSELSGIWRLNCRIGTFFRDLRGTDAKAIPIFDSLNSTLNELMVQFVVAVDLLTFASSLDTLNAIYKDQDKVLNQLRNNSSNSDRDRRVQILETLRRNGSLANNQAEITEFIVKSRFSDEDLENLNIYATTLVDKMPVTKENLMNDGLHFNQVMLGLKKRFML